VVNPLKVCPQCGAEYPANARFCEIDGTALRSAAGDTDLVGSIVADRYHILKKLGEGGMGQVYLAEHVKMGRKSALKVMHASMVKDVDAISRFNREASNASRINHPNVAAIYDFGETPQGMIFLAMEFVDGPPLTKVIEQSGALAPQRAAELLRQSGEALAVAHDMGIVHRDLKPDNIMVARTRDGGDLAKVVDFGIAKAAGSEAQKVTKTGLVVGTPEYMSPEQLAGDKLDGRSDIYSLALVGFNMLTGTLPFPSDSAQESMIMRLTDRPKTLAEMRPQVSWPADVQQVMDKALERDVAQRYQTATEFVRDLYRAIERMPDVGTAGVGTMVQVPPTRVNPDASPPPPRTSIGRQAAAPEPSAGRVASAPSAPAAPAVTQTAAPPKRTGMMVAIGGIAAVIVAAVIFVPLLKGGPAKQNQPSGASQPPTADTSASVAGASGKPADPATQQQASEQFGKTQPAAKGPASDPAGGSRSSTTGANLETQLSDLLDASKVRAQGASVLGKLSRLEPQVTTSREIYLAATLRANVLVAKLDSTGACNTYKTALAHLNADDAVDARGKMETVCRE